MAKTMEVPGGADTAPERKQIWLRGLAMLLFAVLFSIAETVLLACAVVQFFWMLLAGGRNRFIAEFGESLSRWLAAVARFQTGATEDKPFPWARWP